jgi:hypothetical protein
MGLGGLEPVTNSPKQLAQASILREYALKKTYRGDFVWQGRWGVGALGR